MTLDLSSNRSATTPHLVYRKTVGGFKVRKRTWSTIQGFEGIRISNKKQFDFWLRRDELKLRVQ